MFPETLTFSQDLSKRKTFRNGGPGNQKMWIFISTQRWPWVNHITSLGLNFFIYKMKGFELTYLSSFQIEHSPILWLSLSECPVVNIDKHAFPAVTLFLFGNRHSLTKSQDIWILSDLRAQRRHGLKLHSLFSSRTKTTNQILWLPVQCSFPFHLPRL